MLRTTLNTISALWYRTSLGPQNIFEFLELADKKSDAELSDAMKALNPNNVDGMNRYLLTNTGTVSTTKELDEIVETLLDGLKNYIDVRYRDVKTWLQDYAVKITEPDYEQFKFTPEAKELFQEEAQKYKPIYVNHLDTNRKLKRLRDIFYTIYEPRAHAAPTRRAGQ